MPRKKAEAAPAAKKPGKTATPLNVGSTWTRRSDGVDVTVVALGKDDTVSTITAAAKKAGKEPSTSKLVFFRRRFQHKKG